MKNKFTFEPFDMLFDIYVDGMKVRDAHAGRTGHVYLHFQPGTVIETKAHDPRIPTVDEVNLLTKQKVSTTVEKAILDFE